MSSTIISWNAILPKNSRLQNSGFLFYMCVAVLGDTLNNDIDQGLP